MASDNFWYQPTTGTGNTMISVSAETTNMTGTADKIATIALTAGSATKNVTVKQKYKPVAQQFASTTFPATGGDIYFTIHSEYDVVFRSVPDWITISYNGTVYSEGQRISSGAVDGKTFTLTADPNTGASRSVANTFNMGHYIGNTLQQYVSYFSFTQLAGSVSRDMQLSSTAITATSAGTSATLVVLTTGCSFVSMTYYNTNSSFPVTAVKNGNNINLTFSANTGSQRSTTISFTLVDEESNHYTRTCTLTQAKAYVATGWYATNTSTSYGVYGNLMTGTSGSYAGLELLAGETENHTEAVPATLTAAYLALSPTPATPDAAIIVLSSSRTGQAITCNYNGSAWAGTGSISLQQGDYLTVAVTISRGVAGTEDEEETPEETE